jgi:hypothetical protein
MKRGPEIKMPKLHAPQFLVDLYYDLYDRHLLPVVGVLLVGIVAIPLLLGGSSSSDEANPSVEAEAAAAAAAASAAAVPSAMVVTKAAPGLRNYRRRLDHLHAKDPFRPQPGQVAEAEDPGSSTSSETETEVEVEAEGGSVETGGGDSGGTTTVPTPASTETKTEVTYYSVAIDIRINPLSPGEGKPSQGEPYVRHDLPSLVMLPSRDTPALTYMGPSRDGKKALMVVSSNVTSLFGDSPCVIGSAETCQLLALEPGLPETVVWGANGRTYKFELLDMHLVASDHVNRAPLGKPQPQPAG